MKRLLPLLLLCLLLLAGCLGPTIKVDAISLAGASFPPGGTFVIEPLNADFPATDLEFMEQAGHLSRALEGHGLTRLQTPRPDTLHVKLGYVLSDPITLQSESTYPVRGRVGSVPRTYLYRDSSGRERSRTVWEPRYGVVGYETRVDTRTEYICEVEVQALAPAEGLPGTGVQPEAQIWKIRATYQGSRNDLRLLLPRMIRAMAPHMGANTGQSIDVDLAD